MITFEILAHPFYSCVETKLEWVAEKKRESDQEAEAIIGQCDCTRLVAGAKEIEEKVDLLEFTRDPENQGCDTTAQVFI